MRSMIPRLLLIAVVGTGCVTRAKHDVTVRALDDANAALADSQAQVATHQARIGELDAALAQAQAQLEALGADKLDLSEQLATAQSRVAALDAEVQLAQRSLADLLKKRAGLKAELDRVTEALVQLGSRQLAAERRVAEYRDMLARFRALIDAGTLDVRIVDGRMVLTMPVDILFPSGSTKLSSQGTVALSQVGTALAGIPGKRFQVEGHTDDVPIRTERFPSNWELAAGRALVVVHALLGAGVAPAQLSAASFSEYEPRTSNADDQGRALNRRIEIVVLPDLTGLPGNEELERLGAKG